MTDTAEKARRIACTFPATSSAYAMLHRYADLLKRIERAPVAPVSGGHGGAPSLIWVSEQMNGKRVRLVVEP